jgi:hypothetical protein
MHYHSRVPESIDGQMTGRMLYFDESGHQVEPATVSAVDGVDAAAVVLDVPEILPEAEPAAPEVATDAAPVRRPRDKK